MNKRLSVFPLSHEMRFLAAVCNPFTDESAPQPEEWLNWHEVFRLARRHGVMPVFFRRASHLIRQRVSEKEFAEWTAMFRSIQVEAMLMTAELIRIQSIFESQAIPSAAIKGPALSQLIYNDPFMRTYGDLDILIRLSDLKAAYGILTAEGYKPIYKIEQLRGKRMRFMESNFHHIKFANPDSNIVVELHWMLSSLPGYFNSPATERFLSRRQPVEIQGKTAWGLNPEDMLMFLILHGAVHAWCWLKWLCDAACFIKHCAGMDMEAVLRIAQRSNLDRPAAQGLFLMHRMFGCPLPATVSKRLTSDPALAKMVFRAVGDLLNPAGRKPRKLEGLWLTMYRYRFQDKLSYKMKTYHQTLIRLDDCQTATLPDFLFPLLYYLLRLPLWVRRRYRLDKERTK